MQRRPLILHITGDYPDPSREPTTIAVKRLIDSLTDCDHVVVSLTRTADPRRLAHAEHPAAPGQRLFSIHHFGLPLGAGLLPAFATVALQIERLLARHQLVPDVVHSHRLTFDGIAGWIISRRRAIPHLVSVRGEVESKVLRFKPTYRPLIRRIIADAHRIYYVSAWFRPQLERLIADGAGKSRLLPNIVANTRDSITPVAPRPVIVAAGNLDILEKKGLDRLVAAFDRTADRMPGVGLEIVGGGSEAARARMSGLVAASRHGDRIALRGALPNPAFLAELPTALAFALPSRNETFGMVYTEALFAGVPILYGRGTGIDGHLDGLDVGIGVPPLDVTAVGEGLLALVHDNARLRAGIATAAPELYRRFNQTAQVEAYMSDIAAGIRDHGKSGSVPASTAPSRASRHRTGGASGVN